MELSGSNTAVASDFAKTPGDEEADELTEKLLEALTEKILVDPLLDWIVDCDWANEAPKENRNGVSTNNFFRWRAISMVLIVNLTCVSKNCQASQAAASQ